MKSAASMYPAAVAIALACAALSLAPHHAAAFAPAAIKGREHGLRRAAAAAPDVVVAAAPTPKSAVAPKAKGKRQPSTKKKRSKQTSTKKQQPKRAPGKSASKESPKRQKRAPTAKKGSKTKYRALKDLKLGSTVSGTVVGVSDFGAFINIGYATRGAALLHISQISDEKIENVRDRYKVGDKVEDARVITVDLAKGEAGLSLRPRRQKRRDLHELRVGSEVEGKVVQVVSYGAFVDVGTRVNALLHVSRITGGAVENVRHLLNEGDPVSVHVISTDLKKKTVAVSMLDKKADQYLDQRMKQRQKRFLGTADARSTGVKEAEETKADRCELEYFDQAIQELEDALREREVA